MVKLLKVGVPEIVTPYDPKLNVDTILVGDAAALCDAELAAEAVVAMGFLRSALASAQIIRMSVVSYEYQKKEDIAPAPFDLPQKDFNPERKLLTPAGVAGVIVGAMITGGVVVGSVMLLFLRAKGV